MLLVELELKSGCDAPELVARFGEGTGAEREQRTQTSAGERLGREQYRAAASAVGDVDLLG
jgi:hypothetical protein